MSWRIRGSYFESCNCDAICPCRSIDGVRGGRSTHGVCMGLLSSISHERTPMHTPCVERPPGTPSMRRQGQIASQLHDSR